MQREAARTPAEDWGKLGLIVVAIGICLIVAFGQINATKNEARRAADQAVRACETVTGTEMEEESADVGR
jgi:Flp pilus assembly protein TadG